MSSKIVVTNTAIIINNYEIGDCTKLENFFRIFEPVTHSYYYIGIHYDQDNKRLFVPRGLDIWYIENLFGEQAEILVNKYYKYHKFEDAMIKYLPRDEDQKKTLRFMLGKDEFRYNESKSQLCINLFTGKGKTYLTIAVLVYLGIRGIVITSRDSWLNQWKERTLEYTDINPKDIYYIKGSGNISRLLRMTESQLKRYKLFLITHDSIASYASNHGWESIGELFEHLKIGIKIYDEAHLNFNNICMTDFYTNVYKTYYLTATPGKSQDKEDQIYQLAFKNIPSIDLFDEYNDPHVSYIALMYTSNPSPQQISKCKNKYGLDRNRYTGYVVEQENYYKLLTILLDLANKLLPNPNEQMLIYIGTNNAILKTYDWIINNYPELRNSVGIYTSIVSSEDKEIARRKRIILSTTKSAGEALDIPTLKLTIALAEPYCSKIISKQSLGRTRIDGYYIDVIDVGFEQCRRFYYKKLPIFEKYAKDCSVIKLNKNELETRYQNIINQRTPKKLFEYVKPRKLFEYVNPPK